LALVPPRDNDDLYVLNYGMRLDGFVVSNDLFRDEIDSLAHNPNEQTNLTNFIENRLISYTFVHGEFFPNPEFGF